MSGEERRRGRRPVRVRRVWRGVWPRRHAPPLGDAGLALGPALFVATLLAPAPAGMSAEAQATAAVAAWMASWWLTEAVPLSATALLPLFLFPLLEIRSATEVAAAYGSGVIFLFLGGFILGTGVQKWGLHSRLADAVRGRSGSSAPTLLLSLMAVTAFLSMWMSNTAAAIVMLPVVAQLVARTGDGDAAGIPPEVGSAFMLGVAYAASLGGIATIIGSPPNAVFAGYARASLEEPVSFLRWMQWGVPVGTAGLVLTWLFLTRIAYPMVGRITLSRPAATARQPLGPAQWRVLLVFGAVIALWLARGAFAPLAEGGLSDEGIAIAGAVALFALPAGGVRGARLLAWDDMRDLPWGILVLFGGGIALAGGIESSGLADWIGLRIAATDALPGIAVLLVVIVVTILLTELASNTATAAVLIPLTHGMATALGLEPMLAMVAATTAASCAFMLPVATPPNAVVFASGLVTVRQMARAGVVLNVVMALLLVFAVTVWLPVAWNLPRGALFD